MNKLYRHFTTNPVLSTSEFSYPGRNDRAIEVAASLARSKMRCPCQDVFTILLVGSGVYEPLVCLRSPYIAENTVVHALDSATCVIDQLNKMKLGGIGDPDFFTQKNEWKNFRDLSHPRVLSRQEAHRLYTSHLTLEAAYGHLEATGITFDLIVCNNLVPNLLANRDPPPVSTQLSKLSGLMKPRGCLLLGTIDSSIYPSKEHPKYLSDYPWRGREVYRSLPLELVFWCSRVIVREPFRGGDLIDGYTYLFFMSSAPPATHKLAAGLPGHTFPRGLKPPDFQNMENIDDLWTCSEQRYVWWGVNAGESVAAALGDVFPLGSAAITKEQQQVSLGLLECALSILH